MNPVLIVGDQTYIAKPIYHCFDGKLLKNGWKWRRWLTREQWEECQYRGIDPTTDIGG